LWLFVAVMMFSVAVFAQTPQPFPRPNTPKPSQPPPQPPPSTPTTKPLPPPPNATPATQLARPPATATTAKDDTPTEATLGAPIYPSAVYITSYDAGRGQRFYIFGATVPYAELVGYYRTVLKQKGDELFEAPPTHQFETTKFRDESMAFVPSVTIKDYTYGGSAGYPNPKKDGTPARFPTVIQIVPAPR